MTSEQTQRIYFSKSGRPTQYFQPDDLTEWVAARAAENICFRLGRNTIDATDIHVQFDVNRALWGHSPARAAAWIADEWWKYNIESRR